MNQDLLDAAAAAAVDLVGKTGATSLEVGWTGDPTRRRWYAHAEYRGTQIEVGDRDNPGEALNALVVRLLHGGRCVGCGKLCAISDDPVPIAARMLDGEEPDPNVERDRGVCHWTRLGRCWVRGCGPAAPDDSSREKLAQALAAAHAPSGMIAAARCGRWDDYRSEHPNPAGLLVDELRANNLDHLVDRVLGGDFDATRAEGDAWAASAEGLAAFAEFGITPAPTRRPWRSKLQRKGR